MTKTRLFAMTVAAVLAPAGCAAKPTAQATGSFGPDGFGRLKLGMTEAEALATGDLAAGPVSTVTGCTDYSFTGGPKPDPSRMAADAEIERRADEAAATAERLNTDTSAGSAAVARANAEAAEAAAASAQRSADRLEAFTKAGGVSFGAGQLRLMLAPPQARTAAGIGHGSTVKELTAAYAGEKIVRTSDTRYEFPVASRPGWTFAFDLARDRVDSLLLLNPDIDCP